MWIAIAAVAGAALGVAFGRRSGRRVGGQAREQREYIHESDERVMQAIETLPLGIVLYDGAGQRVFHNSSAMVLGGNRHQRPLVDAALEDVSSWAGVHGQAERSLDLFGPPRQVLEFRGSQVMVDGASIGVVVIIEDVTEQRRSVEVRRDFVANVSHELKTPVGAMGILAEALVDTDDPAVVDRLAGRLHAEAIRLGNTIDDLLALSEIESGSLSDEQLVDPSTVVAAALARYCGGRAAFGRHQRARRQRWRPRAR
ncbi:MAG: histidine kinase dimerization/phospho-acceptor domain-containing protein [Acidimicrobiales bacterium]